MIVTSGVQRTGLRSLERWDTEAPAGVLEAVCATRTHADAVGGTAFSALTSLRAERSGRSPEDGRTTMYLFERALVAQHGEVDKRFDWHDETDYDEVFDAWWRDVERKCRECGYNPAVAVACAYNDAGHEVVIYGDGRLVERAPSPSMLKRLEDE